jgi:hypothetical protein
MAVMVVVTMIKDTAVKASTDTPIVNQLKNGPTGNQEKESCTISGCSAIWCGSEMKMNAALIATIQPRTRERPAPAQAKSQLNVLLRFVNKTMRKKTSIGPTGISQVKVVSNSSDMQ